MNLDTKTQLDAALGELKQGAAAWAATSVQERMAVLNEIKDCLMPIAEAWAVTAARKKLIPAGSPLVGEEWLSGPYAILSYCNNLLQTLADVAHKAHIHGLPVSELANGQIKVRVVPHTIWDRLLLSGVKAEVWMQPEVTRANLAQHTASCYDTPAEQRRPGISLVLGAGNIAAIAPLDVFHKLLVEHQAAILKLNPVNDYLHEYLQVALAPLIRRNALRVVRGGADVGQYLCTHPDIQDIHITGAGASHDAIVWGSGEQGRQNKATNTPINTRHITSELGAVCPTIVVPGPWSEADLRFQAENVSTQKLHNSGFNCIACQVLIISRSWEKTPAFLQHLQQTLANSPPRAPYYPGAENRMSEYAKHTSHAKQIGKGTAAVVLDQVAPGNDGYFKHNEVFSPAMSSVALEEQDPEKFLRAAITYANEQLYGTLGANILIHPKTLAKIGRKRFEQILAELHYGCIAINAWTGLGFLLSQTPWGAFPGHTLADVQSGIGFVHNSFLFDKPQRTVVEAPWRPFPRGVWHGQMSLLPRPPWFVSHKRADKVGRLLTRFQYRPGWLKLPGIFYHALLG